MPATLKDELIATRRAWTYFHETEHVYPSVESVPLENIPTKRRTDPKRMVVSAWYEKYAARQRGMATWYHRSQLRVRRLRSRSHFTQLARRWKHDTAFQANITAKAMHPAYQRIIGMGREAVPLILEEFQSGHLDDWFWALAAITGANPIAEDIAGDVERMAEAWLQWGRARGYLNDFHQQLRLSFRT